MSVEFWLYPGAFLNVSAPTKVSMTPVAPGETAPPGTMIVPPQSPSSPVASSMIQAGAAANLEVARQGLAAAQELTNQQTQQAHEALNVALQKSNEAAAALAKEQADKAVQAAPVPPPWSVTITERK